MVSLVCTLHTHRDDVNCCVFSGSLLATCSADKSISVFSTTDFSEAAFSPLRGHGYGVHCCCFSPCAGYLASCSTDASTVLWAMGSGEMEAVLEHPGRSAVRVCAFAPDASLLMSGGADGTVALWDFTSRTLHKYTEKLYKECVCAVRVKFVGMGTNCPHKDGDIENRIFMSP